MDRLIVLPLLAEAPPAMMLPISPLLEIIW